MKRPSNLLDQEDAVGSYLADMLSEPVEDTHPSTTLSDNAQLDNLVLLRQALDEISEDTVEEALDEIIDEVVEDVVEEAVDVSESAAAETAFEAELVEFPMQCLMFSVAEQQLSMPLIKMSGVVEYPESLSRLPGSSQYTLGVFQYRGSNVQVIDSAGLLGIKRDPDRRPAKLIVLQGEKWAITADQLSTVVEVDEPDVKWNATKQAALTLGTIKASLAQLLSPQAIVDRLEKGKVL